jgi:hypothetical protein
MHEGGNYSLEFLSKNYLKRGAKEREKSDCSRDPLFLKIEN